MTFNETSDPRDTSLFNCTISGAPLASYLQPWSILAGVVIAGSCLLGVPANFTIIAQLGRHLRGSSMTQRLFFNLALSDLLCLLCLPIGMYVFYSGTCLMDGLNRCLFYCFIFCVTTDLNILVLISIQRYYQVLHPEKWVKVDRMWQRILLFSVWMLGAFVALPAVFMTRNEARTEKTGGPICNNLGIKPELEAAYISFVVFSYLVLFSFYLLLVKGVKRTQMPNKKQPRATKIFIRIIAVYLVTGFFPVFLRTFYVVALFTGRDSSRRTLLLNDA
ncbi:C5a anaphylatoxin chemotactic receptor 1-like isoform X2 [Betta splendens]|uniref:C5a anaphylatoxin chemotactic receptor 1-like isoform X2 n=1 Tax=Betta splendens TaxID=158456 RepID=A0A9W2Y0G8_BETSP|nr:C5a anaphylatoxin chemotactic receptor 1-like isoform X2 [Betta splendens]